jgi:hypothetical protein
MISAFSIDFTFFTSFQTECAGRFDCSRCGIEWGPMPRVGKQIENVRSRWRLPESEAAARELLALPRPAAAVRRLMREMLGEDLLRRRAAANVARLISLRRPGLLHAYVDLMAELAAETPLEEWAGRSYLLLAAALNAENPVQRRKLAALARAMAGENRVAVQANALEALAALARDDKEVREEIGAWLGGVGSSASPAIRARAKRLHKHLLDAEIALRQ